MKITVEQIDGSLHFQAANEEGNIVHLDANPTVGGQGKGVRPMQLLLMGLGGCSGIDVVLILKKQKLLPERYWIEIDGERQKNAEPALFETIDVRHCFKGELDPDKLKRAVALSMDKYCSVAKTLEHTAKITYSVELNNHAI